jgi:hypothetical protein
MSHDGALDAELLEPSSLRWSDALARMRHDVYHHPAYSRIASLVDGGTPVAVYVGQDEAAFLAPIALHPAPGGEKGGFKDAVGPYGYPGPLLSTPSTWPLREREAFLRRALEAMRSRLERERVLTTFLRMHPILALPQAPFREAGVIVEHGNTVSIDLTLSDADRLAGYRENHRRDIRRATAAGLTVPEVTLDENAIDEFVAIYHETMGRAGAGKRYYFPAWYFRMLRDEIGPTKVHVFAVRAEHRVIAAAMFTESCGIVQYHLGGTRTEALRQRPHKLLYEHVASWARQRGNELLHLGGGVGGAEDSLFAFKAGFSALRHRFTTWRQVTSPELYAEFVGPGARATSDDGFFPAHRRPRD